MSIAVEIVELIPFLFHRLKAVGDVLHAEHGITTPMRGVMMSLNDHGPQTVPQLAAARPVSRQFIQTLVDALAEKGLVQTQPNPRHKRSSLVDLTDEGCELMVKMRQTESGVIDKTLGQCAHVDLEAAHKVLSGFAEQLNMVIKQQEGGQS